jgi:multisubunit Na+/H+ antiporter MnhE subunit
VARIECIKVEKAQPLTNSESILTNSSTKTVGTLSIELDISLDDLKRHFVHRIKKSEVKDALRKMKGGKAMGPDWIPIEV